MFTAGNCLARYAVGLFTVANRDFIRIALEYGGSGSGRKFLGAAGCSSVASKFLARWRTIIGTFRQAEVAGGFSHFAKCEMVPAVHSASP